MPDHLDRLRELAAWLDQRHTAWNLAVCSAVAEIERLRAERDAAVREEREACAQIALTCIPPPDYYMKAGDIAAAIRARGRKP